MSNGGGAAARRGRVALGVAACLLLAACGSNSDSDLEERVTELQEENEALRAQLDALQATATTSATTAGSQPATDSMAPSTPATTVAPTTARPAALGTRENPHPLGEPVPAGDWIYTVLAFEPNVTDLVTQLSANNEPAGEGKVYSRLRLRATFRGRGAGAPRRLNVNLLSPTGAIFGETTPCCEPERDSLTDQPEVFTDASVEGWLYYTVTAADLFAGKFLAFDPEADQTNVPGGVVFFEIN